MSGHQFEPLFEASIAELESVGLSKTPRELYLSYLRKMPANLQKEIRSDKRLWPTDEKEPSGSATLRGPKTWEEAHKLVLEYEHREATHKASANSVFTYDQDPPNSAAGEARKEPRSISHCSRFRIRERVRARRSVSTLGITVVAPKGRIARTPMTRSFASRPSLTEATPVGVRPMRPLLARDPRVAVRARPKQRPKPKPGRRAVERERAASPRSAPSSPRMGPATRGQAAIWCTPCPWRLARAHCNPFAAFSIQVGSAGISLAASNHVGSTPQVSLSVLQGHAVHSLPLEKATPNSGKLMSLDELPQDWWHVAENEVGGY